MKAAVHAAILERVPLLSAHSPDSFLRSFLVCLDVFGRILYDDWIELEHIRKQQKLGFPEDHTFQEPILVEGGEVLTLVCSFCQGDIWNRHLICDDNCSHPKTKPYVLCNECFGKGRGCPHRDTSNLVIRQCFQMSSAVKLFEESASKIIKLQESTSSSWFRSSDITPWKAT